MTKAEKAVAIAKDVLKHIDNYKGVSTGHYVSGELPISFINQVKLDDSVQPHIDIVQKKCKVCALGACFLSYIRIHNKVDFGSLGLDGYDANFDLYHHDIDEKLKSIFSSNQLDEIEAAFEMTTYNNSSYDELLREEAIAFGKQYKNSKERLIAIMKNIVKNKGKFIP